MHIVKFDQRVHIFYRDGGSYSYDGDVEYVMDDTNAGEMLSKRGFRKVWVNELPDDEVRVFSASSGEDYNGKSVLLCRPGGVGDLLFLTPILHHLRKKFPQMMMTVACAPQFTFLFHHNPDVDCIEAYPVSYRKWKNFDAHCSYEGIIENNPEAQRLHAVKLYAQRAGLLPDELEDKRYRYFVTTKERYDRDKRWGKKEPGERWVGVQLRASADCRTYPPQPMMKLFSLLISHPEIRTFALGFKGELNINWSVENGNSGKPPNFVNTTEDGMTLRELAALVEAMDCVVAPDSSLVHLASALDVGCVGLYGSFPSALRANSKKLLALEGRGECAPCFFHGEGWPPGGPCNQHNACVVLGAIPPESIVQAVHEVFARNMNGWRPVEDEGKVIELARPGLISPALSH